jgi:hypothetical protein
MPEINSANAEKKNHNFMAVDIFPLAYLAPVDWYALYFRSPKPLIELYDTIPRQSIHSRCVIDGPQNPVKLSIPVINKGKVITRDARISYREKWVEEHVQSLKTTYRNSPYFPYFEDDLFDILFTRFTFLTDLNIALHNMVIRLLRTENHGSYTHEWTPDPKGNDYRNWPKNTLHPEVPSIEYPQQFNKPGKENTPVFSIVDLLANEGAWGYEKLRIEN